MTQKKTLSFFILAICLTTIACYSSTTSTFSSTLNSESLDFPTNAPILGQRATLLSTTDSSAEIYWSVDSSDQNEFCYQSDELETPTCLTTEISPSNEAILTLSALASGTEYNVIASNGSTISFKTKTEGSVFLYPNEDSYNFDSSALDVDTNTIREPLQTDLSQRGKSTFVADDLMQSYTITNLTVQRWISPFWYSPKALNRQNLSALRHQIKISSSSPEERILLAFLSISDGLQHHCAAGDQGFFARSSIDLLNSYGFACCDQAAIGLTSLIQSLGYYSIHTAFDGGGGHSVTEVYYDGSFHLLDPDKGGFFRNDDEKILDIIELLAIDNPSSLGYGYWSLLPSTTIYYRVEVGRENRIVSGDYAWSPSITQLQQNWIPWSVFPDEEVSFTLNTVNSTPISLSPYSNDGSSVTTGTGRITQSIDVSSNSSDPRFEIGSNSLTFYVFSSFPVSSAQYSLVLQGNPDQMLRATLIIGQETPIAVETDDLNCDKIENEFCHITLNVTEMIQRWRDSEALSDIFGSEVALTSGNFNDNPYPFFTQPKLYLKLEYAASHASILTPISLGGEVTFQTSTALFPELENLDDFSLLSLDGTDLTESVTIN